MNPTTPQKNRIPTKTTRQVPLDAVTILKYLIGTDTHIETAILCAPSNLRFITSDAALYQAIGSLKDYDNVHTHKIAKLLESTIVVPQPKWPLTHERVEELRSLALKDNAGQLTQ